MAVAKRLGRQFVGCEMSGEYREKINRRLAGVVVEAQVSQVATKESLNATIRKKLASGEIQGVRPPEQKAVVKGKALGERKRMKAAKSGGGLFG